MFYLGKDMFAAGVGKIVFFFAIWIFLWLPVAIPLSRQINYQFPQVATTKQKLILVASLYPIALLILWGMVAKHFLSWRAISWSWELKELWLILFGVALAISSLIVVFAIQRITGLIVWQIENSSRLLSLVLPIFALALGISFVEELVFRGFLVGELAIEHSYWLGAIASSILFAVLHLVWERQETIPQLPGLWLMGMVLTLATVAAENKIGIAVGLHAGWILGLTAIDSAELVNYNTAENSWLTGINRQPLAGAFGILCLLLVGAILLLLNGKL